MNMADWVEATAQRTSSSVVDRMAPTVRNHSTGMVGPEDTMVRVDGVVLLEVEDEVGQVDEDAKASVYNLDRKSHVLSPFGTYRWMCD